MHTMNQFFHFNNGYAGMVIGHGVGNDQFVVMNHRTAGINLIFRGLKFEPDAEIGQKGAF